MDKRMEANRIVKVKIGKALMRLMGEKSFSDISITDIVSRAGVARTSYYRNFCSKEDVLVSLTTDIMETYRTRLENDGCAYDSYDGILLMFRYFRTYGRYVLCIYQAGLASVYQTIFDQLLESVAGDMRCTDINRYRLYFFSGAIYNVFIKWVENDMKESCEDMARLLCQFNIMQERNPDIS